MTNTSQIPTMRHTLSQKVVGQVTGQPKRSVNEDMGYWLLNKRGDIRDQLLEVTTGDEAVAFFVRNGKTNPIKILYCNKTPNDITVFKPYDLVVVDEGDIEPEHYTISLRGVVHIKPIFTRQKNM